MASKEIGIQAIATPAPGKAERFKELTAEAIRWVEGNEPGTLQFEMHEVEDAEGIKIMLFERYASQEAVDRHRNSEEYKKFFANVTEEELLTGAPQIVTGKAVTGFRR